MASAHGEGKGIGELDADRAPNEGRVQAPADAHHVGD